MSENNKPLELLQTGLPRMPPHPLDGEWYLNSDSQTYGPFTGHQIKNFIADGRVSDSTEVLRVGQQEWTTAREDRFLAPLFGPTVPSHASRPSSPPIVNPVAAGAGATVVQVTNHVGSERQRSMLIEDGPARPKSAGLALLLSFLIVGVGQMYNGQVGKGLMMLVLCVALWFAFLGWIINIWSMIDAYQTASRMNERYQRRLAAGVLI